MTSQEQQEFILENGSKWDVGASILAKEEKGWTKFSSKPTIEEIIKQEHELNVQLVNIEQKIKELKFK